MSFFYNKLSRKMKKINSQDTKTPETAPEVSQNNMVQEEPLQGIRYPWEVFFSAGIGLASEFVDAMLMSDTLSVLTPNLSGTLNTTISLIIGAGCFFTMAFAGFLRGNRKYYSAKGDRIAFWCWLLAGIALVATRLFSGMISGSTTIFDVSLGDATIADLFATEEFVSNLVVGLLQFVLYISTGFLTRDSIHILTDNNIREYNVARREYNKLLEQLSKKRGTIIKDVSRLKAYPKYAERLVRSKSSTKRNIAQYNEAARALVEIEMAITVEPDLMEGIYDHAMSKQKQLNHKAA